MHFPLFILLPPTHFTKRDHSFILLYTSSKKCHPNGKVIQCLVTALQYLPSLLADLLMNKFCLLYKAKLHSQILPFIPL